MTKRTFKKYGYYEEEYNHSLIRRLYFLYLHDTFFDRILSTLVHFAIGITFLTVVLELFFHPSDETLFILHSFSVLVLFIFGLELFREYAHSNTKKSFFRHHWLDFTLVTFLSFYFLMGSYLGLGRIGYVIELKNYLSEFKHYKIAARFFRFRI